MHFLTKALLEGSLTQPYYLFMPLSEFQKLTGDTLDEKTYTAAKDRCCEALVLSTVDNIKRGLVYTFDWRPDARRALAFLGKDMSHFTDVRDLYHDRTYRWNNA